MNLPTGVSSTFPAADGDGYELQMGRWSRRLAGPFLDFVGSANDGPQAEYVATLSDAEREKLRNALRLAYVDGEPDGPRSYAALAWAVKGIAPI